MSILVLLMALLGTPDAAAEPVIALELVASGLFRPLSITHAGDERLFFTEQVGRVRVHDGQTLLTAPFLDLTAMVSGTGEQGLLSVAFHPRYAENGYFFVNYTNQRGDTVVARYTVSASEPNRAEPASVKVILEVDQPFANHNGGQMQFGPDGYLWIGMGDGGSGGDPSNRAQNLGDLLGKLLRIDVDSGDPYAIPPDNPFAGHPTARREIWAYGLRNPWRFSFDRATGDLWIADVGQGDWEEVDFQPAGSIGGENYGWRLMEGTHCYNPPSNCNDGTLVQPLIEYGHDEGGCSVTGGYVYRGARSPRLHGLYLYGDYCDGVLRGARRDGGTAVSSALYDTGFLITTFGEDVLGEIYVADYSNGRILRIVDTQPVGPKRRAVRH